MADQEVSIKFNSDANDAIAANNALIASLKQLEAQHSAVKNTFGKGFGSARAGGSSGNFDTRNRRTTTPSGGAPPSVPPSGGGPPSLPPLPPVRPPSGGGGGSFGGAEADKSNASVKNLTQSFSTLGGTIKSVVGQAAAFTGVTVGVAALGNEIYRAINAVSQLDSAMSAVAAVGGLAKSSAELGVLTQQVMELGSKTQYGAVGAAEGLKELIAAGYSSGDASKLLADTLALAATESMGMGRASEIVVAGLQAFGLEVSEGTRLADVLARSANASTASIDDMGEALKYAAPVSKALGVTLEETNAVLAILANNGIRGGMAGRGLSSVMAKMVAPTKDAVEALRELGMGANDLNPQIVGVEASLKRLASLPQVQLVKMFGVENLDISNILGKNADGFAKMNEYMSKANVSARSMSEIRMDNLAGDMLKLSSALTELRIEIVGKEYESIRDVVQEFTSYLRENKDVIAENVKKVGDLAVTLGQVVTAYAAIKGVQFIGHLVKSISQWALETKMIDANTGALGRNAGARGRAKGGKGGGIAGAILPSIGFMVGMEAAPEDAGMVEQLGYGLGGAALGKGLEKGVLAIARPLLARALTAAVTTSLGTALAGAGAAIAAFAAAFAAPLVVIGAVVAGTAVAWNHLAEGAKNAQEAVDGYGRSVVDAARKSVQGASDEEALLKSKQFIQRQINGIGEEIVRINKAGGEGVEEQIEALNRTRTMLYSIYNNAEKINQRAQERLRLEQEVAKHNQTAHEVEKQRARTAAEIAENIRQQVEAAKEFNAAYEARRDTAVSGLNEAGQLDAAGADYAEAKGDVEKIRKDLDGSAKSAITVANELVKGAGAFIENNILGDNKVAQGMADMPAEKRQLALNQQLDPRVKPSDIEAPKGGIVEFTQQQIDGPKMTDPVVKGPQITFDKEPALTDVNSIATYYKKVLEEAKKSGNIKLQAEVEGYMADLDKAVKASIEAGKKIEQALAQRDAQVISLLPTESQGAIANNNFADSIKAAEEARDQIDAILAEQGMEPLVDPKKEFKNAQDISDYYRRTSEAIKAAGRIDLLTKMPFADLTQSMNKNDAAAKEQSRIKGIEDQKTMTMKGIEMTEAKANNDPRRQEQLRVEMELMKEQQSIMSSMNLSGKDGEAEAKKIAARKIGADLRVSLNEQNAEMNPLGEMKKLGDGATAMNQLFGRASNSGMLENAKKQSEYLKQLVELAKIKESIKYIATVA